MEEWRKNAACRGKDPNIFIPPYAETKAELAARNKKAKAICAGCVVADQCLSFALTQGEDGVWGNTTGRERRRLRETAASR